MDDSSVKVILEQGKRTEAAITSLASEMRDNSQALVKGFASLQTALAGALKVTTNGNGLWPVATFTIVILSLGTMLFAQQTSQSETMTLLDSHQRERSVALDTLLQKEIYAAQSELKSTADQQEDFVKERFTQAEEDSARRHSEQQTDIDEIKSWFRAPALRTNGIRGAP